MECIQKHPAESFQQHVGEGHRNDSARRQRSFGVLSCAGRGPSRPIRPRLPQKAVHAFSDGVSSMSLAPISARPSSETSSARRFDLPRRLQLLPGKTDAGRKRGLGESVTDATVGRRKILIGGNVRQGAGADGRFVCVSSANSLELLKVELTGFPNDFFWCRK